MDALENLKLLPKFCATLNLSNRCQVILIERGVRGYYPQRTYETVEEAQRFVDRYNTSRSISPAQILAMEIGSCFGWEVPGANALSHAGHTSRKEV